MFEDTATNPAGHHKTTIKKHEPSEEVDDIELIFSSDDKDFEQDDLVSIGGEYEPWEKAGTSGTPVLVKFTRIGSDQDDETLLDKPTTMDDDEHSQSNEDLNRENSGSSKSSVAVDIRRDDSYDTFDPVRV